MKKEFLSDEEIYTILIQKDEICEEYVNWESRRHEKVASIYVLRDMYRKYGVAYSGFKESPMLKLFCDNFRRFWEMRNR